MKTTDIPIPECWPDLVRRAMIHVASLAREDMIYIHETSDNKNQPYHVREASVLERKDHEIKLLREHIRIVTTRISKISLPHLTVGL